MADLLGADGGLRELALFAGAGGGILGGHLLGWRTVCAVEYDPYAASVLLARQNDGALPPFPIWDDVQTFDGRPWRGIVDVVSGGFPCQDISVAGKGAGIDGERSGLWSHMARIVGEVRPRFVFVENSPALVTRGLGRVLGDLAALGYDCRWTVLGAADVGAPHQRDRFWLVANAEYAGVSQRRRAWVTRKVWSDARGVFGDVASCSEQQEESGMADANGMRQLQPQGSKRDEWGRIGDGSEDVAHASCKLFKEFNATSFGGVTRQHPGRVVARWDGAWWATEPDVGRVADGVAARVDRLKAIGNGQVPAVAAAAWRLLTGA